MVAEINYLHHEINKKKCVLQINVFCMHSHQLDYIGLYRIYY